MQWLLLAACILGAVLLAGGPEDLPRTNHWVQDLLASVQPHTRSNEVVIVAIDSPSLASIGRWPWRRALHAQLVQHITAQQPRAIGLDILFSEEDPYYPEDDVLLTQALRRSARVVLPVTRRAQGLRQGTERPVPSLAQAAAGLGHVHLHADADGVARGFYRLEGPPSTLWPHLGLVMLCTGGHGLPECQRQVAQASPGSWVRQQAQKIAFTPGSPPFPTYSYIDVLRGQVPSTAFTGKYVVVGATASGLGDLWPAPSGLRVQHKPNVEFTAHILHNELTGVRWEPLGAGKNRLLNFVPVALALWALALLGPSAALAVCGALWLLVLLAAGMTLWLGGVMPAPAAALWGIAVAYPLWSWRRLSIASAFLRAELQHAGLHLTQPAAGLGGQDLLQRNVQAVERASHELRSMHHFVSASLQQLPSPTLVCDAQGRLLLVNAAAERYTGQSAQALEGQEMPSVLHQVRMLDSGAAPVTLQALQDGSLPAQVQCQDADGRSLLLLAQTFALSQHSHGWLVTLVDWSATHRAQQQRDQAMHFISHDIRAPVASIVTLLEMQRAFPAQMPAQELWRRIEHYALASLTLADDFVHLAGAESASYQLHPVDLVPLLHEAADALWVRARDAGVPLHLELPESPALCLGERARLVRAIVNVLSNAIKFSPQGQPVQVRLTASGTQWCIAVRDQGPGLDAAQQSRLFQPFVRLHTHSHPEIAGSGLGLAFVHTVLAHHAGHVQVHSAAGQGAEFSLWLPRTADNGAAQPLRGVDGVES